MLEATAWLRETDTQRFVGKGEKLDLAEQVDGQRGRHEHVGQALALTQTQLDVLLQAVGRFAPCNGGILAPRFDFGHGVRLGKYWTEGETKLWQIPTLNISFKRPLAWSFIPVPF